MQMMKMLIHLILLVVVFLIPSLWIIYRPQYFQKIKSSSLLNESITIYRELNGFPHIISSSFSGSLYGLGYVHCQDRLFAMILKKIVVEGRMSEFLGPDMISLDTYFHQLGLHSTAIANLQSLTQEDLHQLNLYSQGINDCVAYRNALPWEMKLLNIPFESWTPKDTMAQIKLISFFLAFDYKYEALREQIAKKIGEKNSRLIMGGLYNNEQLLDDFPDTVILKEEIQQMNQYQKLDPKNVVGQLISQIQNDDKSKDDYMNDNVNKQQIGLIQESMYEMIRGLTSGVKGSNNWIISGEHTESGGVLLASDPHLDNGIPTSWHLSEINFYDHNKNELFIVGVTMPGMPVFTIGRNNKLAFAVTVLFNDNSDLFLETLDSTATKYLFDGQFYDIITSNIQIKVKGQPNPVIIQRRSTRKGPILEKLLGGKDNLFNKMEETVSLGWSGFDQHYHNFNKTMNFSQQLIASDMMEMISHQRDISLNFLIGSEDGDICYYPMGAHPIKQFKDGGFYKDGSKKNQEWKGYLNYSSQTKLVNPSRGWIATANNKNMPDDSINTYTFGQPITSRSKRIHEMIQTFINQNKKMNVQDMMKMQSDIVDVIMRDNIQHWIGLVQKMIFKMQQQQDKWIIGKDTIIKEVLQRLEEWNCSYDRNSREAAIIGQWELLMSEEITKFIPQQFNHMVMGSFHFHQFLFKYIQVSHLHFSTPHNYSWADSLCPSQSCLYTFVHTLYDSIRYHQHQSWGHLHQQFYPHILAHKIPILNLIFDRSFPSSGNSRTVSNAMTNYEKLTNQAFHGSNLRFVFDLKAKSYYTLDIGNSENYFSPNYDDMFQQFQSHQYSLLYYGRNQTSYYPFKISIN